MSKQDIEKRLGFAAQGAKATFAEFNVGDKVVATPNNHIDAYGRIIKIENGIATIASAEGNVKAKLSDLELVKKGSVEDLRRLGMKGFARPGVKAEFYASPEHIPLILAQTRKMHADSKKAAEKYLKAGSVGNIGGAAGLASSMVNALENDLKNDLYRLTQSRNPVHKKAAKEAYAEIKAMADWWYSQYKKWTASRPGVKAKFADAALNQIRNNAAISDKILTLVSKGLSVPQAIDSVLGEGTYKRIGSEVYDELKKAKSSRPGTKAKMSATFIVAEAIFNAENAVRRGDNENARRWIKAAQDAMDETVVSTGMRSKLEQLVKRYKMSRPGVKAKFDREVGRKGNKSAMIAKNGPDADASWLAWVVQHHGEGQGESVLGTMRSYSTEARAKAAALRGLETSGLRGGFSRPGAKAKA